MTNIFAAVVELVDTPDLGSGALWVWRFESFPRYTSKFSSRIRELIVSIIVKKRSVICLTDWLILNISACILLELNSISYLIKTFSFSYFRWKWNKRTELRKSNLNFLILYGLMGKSTVNWVKLSVINFQNFELK